VTESEFKKGKKFGYSEIIHVRIDLILFIMQAMAGTNHETEPRAMKLMKFTVQIPALHFNACLPCNTHH
jgi:hypothetical protein